MASLNKPFPEIQTQIEKGISILKQGGVVAFPTDTVYGLGASANIHQAVERIYEVKERPRNMALPLLLAHASQVSEVAELVPPIAWILVRNFLPGALTIVFLCLLCDPVELQPVVAQATSQRGVATFRGDGRRRWREGRSRCGCGS